MLISLKQTAVPHTFLTSLRPPPAVNFPWVVSLYTVIEERKRSCRVVCLSGFHLLSSPCWKNHIWEKIRVVFSWDFVSWSRVAHPIVASLLFFFFFPVVPFLGSEENSMKGLANMLLSSPAGSLQLWAQKWKDHDDCMLFERTSLRFCHCSREVSACAPLQTFPLSSSMNERCYMLEGATWKDQGEKTKSVALERSYREGSEVYPWFVWKTQAPF